MAAMIPPPTGSHFLTNSSSVVGASQTGILLNGTSSVPDSPRRLYLTPYSYRRPPTLTRRVIFSAVSVINAKWNVGTLEEDFEEDSSVESERSGIEGNDLVAGNECVATSNRMRRKEMDARPCASPNDPSVIISAADCRLTVWDSWSSARKIR